MRAKRTLRIVLLGGVFVSLVSLLSFVLLGRDAVIVDHHISYMYGKNPSIDIPDYLMLFGELAISLLYGIVAVSATMISRVKNMWYFGVLSALGWILAMVVYYASFGSVWCFLAAVSSVVIYWIIVPTHKGKTTKSPI